MVHLFRNPHPFDRFAPNDATRRRNLARLFGSDRPTPVRVATAADEARYDQVDERPIDDPAPSHDTLLAMVTAQYSHREPWQHRTLRHEYARTAELVREQAARIDDEVRLAHGERIPDRHVFLMADCDRLVADLEKLSGHERQPSLLDRAAAIRRNPRPGRDAADTTAHAAD